MNPPTTPARDALRGVELPPQLIATEPPEARGLARDAVRLMVMRGRRVSHVRFRDLGAFLDAGDLIVVNTSATIAAAIAARRCDGRHVVIHVAGSDGDAAIVEVRRPDQSGPVRDLRPDETLTLAGGGRLRVTSPAAPSTARLWHASAAVDGSLSGWLRQHGRPIAYSYMRRRWPLRAYQTVFARHPGSAEMPSAARPFSNALVTDLVTRGVTFAPLLLHAGVSSLELGETPPPERYEVSAATARLVNATHAAGGRVIAAGTTAVRALETVARRDGTVGPGSGWTDLMLSGSRPTRAVDGLVTGWHEPGSTHLALLEAVAGAAAVRAAYRSALEERYLWHEFGDSCLLLRA